MSMFGETLRQARAHKGVTVKEAEQATRISKIYLSALEDQHFEALPPLIYQRGIVRNYATYLDLDPNKLLTMFEEARGGVVEPDMAPSAPPLNMPSHWAPNFAIIAFVLVLGMIVFAWFYSAFLVSGETDPTATSPVMTVTPIPTDEGDENERESVISLIPTPTATPEPEATSEPEEETDAVVARSAGDDPTPTEAPSPTSDVEDDDPTGEGAADSAVAAESLEEDVPEAAFVAPPTEPVETEPEPAASGITLMVQPSAGVYLTVYGDDVLLQQGWVEAGATAGPWTAESFEFYTSDVGSTWITNMTTGAPAFIMPGSGELTFPLP